MLILAEKPEEFQKFVKALSLPVINSKMSPNLAQQPLSQLL